MIEEQVLSYQVLSTNRQQSVNMIKIIPTNGIMELIYTLTRYLVIEIRM